MWTGVQRGSKPVSVHVPQRDRDRYVDGRSTSQRNRDRHRGGAHVTATATGGRGQRDQRGRAREPVCGRAQRDQRGRVNVDDATGTVDGYHVDATGIVDVRNATGTATGQRGTARDHRRGPRRRRPRRPGGGAPVAATQPGSRRGAVQGGMAVPPGTGCGTGTAVRGRWRRFGRYPTGGIGRYRAAVPGNGGAGTRGRGGYGTWTVVRGWHGIQTWKQQTGVLIATGTVDGVQRGSKPVSWTGQATKLLLPSGSYY